VLTPGSAMDGLAKLDSMYVISLLLIYYVVIGACIVIWNWVLFRGLNLSIIK
jgi:hypothetical protein